MFASFFYSLIYLFATSPTLLSPPLPLSLPPPLYLTLPLTLLGERCALIETDAGNKASMLAGVLRDIDSQVSELEVTIKLKERLPSIFLSDFPENVFLKFNFI